MSYRMDTVHGKMAFIILLMFSLSPAAHCDVGLGFHSIEAYNYKDHYVRHFLNLGSISRVANEEIDRDNATFEITKGLADPKCFSFKASNKGLESYYLRHQFFSIVLNKNDFSDGFKQDATFCEQPGLAGEGSSFISFNYPDRFLRHFLFGLRLDIKSGDSFNSDATFFLKPAVNSPSSIFSNSGVNPIIIVGGTLASEFIYLILETRLKIDGYWYEFFELPSQGKIDIKESARFLKDRIERVLRETKAAKVNIIAHSQGGIVARTYIHLFQGQETVDNMISLAAPHQGTSFVNTELAGLLGCSINPKPDPCVQLDIGSELIKEINQRPANDPIYYTNFVTNNDLFVTPFINGTMNNCDRKNAQGEILPCNIVIQERCPFNLVDHVGLAFNGAVYSGIKEALKHKKVTLDCNAL